MSKFPDCSRMGKIIDKNTFGQILLVKCVVKLSLVNYLANLILGILFIGKRILGKISGELMLWKLFLVRLLVKIFFVNLLLAKLFLANLFLV